ncbi:MAG: PQQ-binding-like beta-propeller repeat protein [Planctomycetota bacterium]
MSRPHPIAILLSVATLCLSWTSQADAQFRGPQGNGVYSDAVPDRWDNETNLSWSVEIPGGGWSSPVVAGDQIFVTTAVAEGDDRPKGFGQGVQSMGSFYRSKAPDKPYSFEVHCLNLSDGSVAWKKQVVSKKPPFKIHPSNSYATESPVTDGNHIYAYFAAVGIVACLDTSGERVWMRDLGAFKTGNDFGTGSSLALHNGRVFVQCDNEQQSFVCALDAQSGEDSWRLERDGGTSWSSPVIWNNKVRTELVTCGSGIVTSYEPETGKELWSMTGAVGAFSASPTFDDERIYLGQSGRTSRGPLVAINAGASGKLTYDSLGEKGLAWVEDSSAPGMCSPVVANGQVFVLSRGILSCHDAASGERLYRERLKDSSSVTASLWATGDKVFGLNESGTTTVVKSGKAFEFIGQNSIAGLYWSTPTATEDTLLLRSADKLHCIRN